MTVLAVETIQETTRSIIPLSIFRRIAEKDENAVKDCVDTYNNFIWALARKFTASTPEAEAATRMIFMDIWRYSKQSSDHPPSDEEVLIALIARRRLINSLPSTH